LDTVEFCHLYLSIPVPSTKDKIINGLQVIVSTIRGAPPPTTVSQLKPTTALQENFESWRTLAPPSLQPNHRPAPTFPRVNLLESPRVVATSPLSTSPTWSPSTTWRPPPQAAVTSPTPAPFALTFQVIPCHLVFGDHHSPRVVSKPQQPLLPPAALNRTEQLRKLGKLQCYYLDQFNQKESSYTTSKGCKIVLQLEPRREGSLLLGFCVPGKCSGHLGDSEHMQIRVAHQLEIHPSLHCIHAAALLLAVLCSGTKAGRLSSCFYCQ
jgi:hypothetical protein